MTLLLVTIMVYNLVVTTKYTARKNTVFKTKTAVLGDENKIFFNCTPVHCYVHVRSAVNLSMNPI